MPYLFRILRRFCFQFLFQGFYGHTICPCLLVQDNPSKTLMRYRLRYLHFLPVSLRTLICPVVLPAYRNIRPLLVPLLLLLLFTLPMFHPGQNILSSFVPPECFYITPYDYLLLHFNYVCGFFVYSPCFCMFLIIAYLPYI